MHEGLILARQEGLNLVKTNFLRLMASKHLASEARHKLEEQLTCSICLDQYTNPKILPCFHTFCLDCLKGVLPEVTQQGHYSLPCPTCRSPCQLPQQGIETLPPSFTINNLTEVYNLLKKVTGNRHTSCDKCNKADAVHYCKQCAKFLCQQCLHQHDEWITGHQTLGLDEVVNTVYQLPQAKPEVTITCTDHSKHHEIFCETCKEFICHLCTVKKHKDHDYDVINDAYDKHKLIICSSLRPLNQQIDRLVEEIGNLIRRRNEITEQGEKTKETTHLVIAQMKELLDQTERMLNEEIDVAMKYKLSMTDHQTKEAEAILGQLTECRDHIEQSLKVDTPQQVLSTKSQMTSRTESLVANTKEKTFKPLEEADITLERDTNKNMKEIPSYVGKINYSTLSPTIAYDHIPLVDNESTVTMTLSVSNGSPAPTSSISCHLTPPDSSKPTIQCTVKDTSQSGQYNIVFTPLTRGLHPLHVKTHNRNIPCSPVSIPVSVPAKMRNAIVKCFITGLNGPRKIAVSDNGQMIISEEKGHCITIATSEGVKVKSFGSKGNGRGQLSSPQGIAITSKGTILVADYGNDRIQEFTMNGECVSCIGSKGIGPLQFIRPYRIAINKTTGQVYVVNTSNHRVQVLNADLKFSHMFGSRGSGQGQFVNPFSITIDCQGLVYVGDIGNNRIQKFTPEGQFVSSFGTKGSEPGQLSSPLDITFDDNDLLYICEGDPNRRISVFTTTGEFVHYFGKDVIGYPTGSVIDKYGYLYVCDNENGDVKIF